MKAQVILYSALAFLIKLAASHPYAADLQRYSNSYQNRPTLEPQYPSNPQRPYQNIAQRQYDGAYSQPAPQFQGQEELLRLNQANYFATNQKRNENEGPPHIQPEVTSGRYINQQRIPNQYYAGNSPEPVIHNTNDNWRGASQRITENQPIKVGYPEVAINDKQYISYSQQTIQHSRFPDNVRDKVREISSPAEDSYHLRPNPVLNESPRQELPHPVPSSKVSTYENHVPIHDNLPQLGNLPEILRELEFAPSIPSVPTRNIHSSNAILKQVNDHYLQVEPVEIKQIPVVQTSTHVEQGTPLNASERNSARAGNPVELPPKPQVQPKPDAISNERIQNVLSTTKHQKRYLVIHPNGKIEHVDSLETIAKQHPNYVLVNAGNVVSGKNETVLTTPKKTVQEQKKTTIEHATAVNNKKIPSPKVEPSDFKVETIVTPPKKPVQENKKSTVEQATAVNNKTIPSIKVEPSGYKVDVIVTKSPSHGSEAVPATSPAPLREATAPVLPKTAAATTTPTSSTTPVTTSQAVATANGSNATAIASADQATNALSSAQAESKNPTPVDSPKVVTTKPTPTSSTPKNIQLSKVEIDKEVLLPIVNNNTESAVNQPQNEIKASAVGSSPISNVESTSSSTVEPTSSDDPPTNTLQTAKSESFKSSPEVKSTSSAETIENSPNNVLESTSTSNAEPTSSDDAPTNTPQTATSENLQSSLEVTSSSSAVAESTSEPDQTTVTVLEIHDQPQEAGPGSKNITKAPKVVPVHCDPADDSPNSIDEYILNEASNNVEPDPNPAEKVPDLGDSDILEKNAHKPVVWFRTSDPNFWSKLTDNNAGFDVVYFFQIHNEPKVVYDTRTTVFPNGTTVEEFTEAKWDFDGDEPKVKKTTTITNPEDQ